MNRLVVGTRDQPVNIFGKETGFESVKILQESSQSNHISPERPFSHANYDM